jgi:hypothetical protein
VALSRQEISGTFEASRIRVKKKPTRPLTQEMPDVGAARGRADSDAAHLFTIFAWLAKGAEVRVRRSARRSRFGPGDRALFSLEGEVRKSQA